MQIVKQLTFSDVNSGDISLGSITTNCPTIIRGSILLGSDFNISTVICNLTFTPSGGSDVVLNTNINNGTQINLEYQLNQGASNPGIFTTVDGLLKINLSTGGANPTTGACTLVVDITAYPVS